MRFFFTTLLRSLPYLEKKITAELFQYYGLIFSDISSSSLLPIYHQCLTLPIVSFQVYIKVIDTNNHRPQFSASKYEVVIPEDTMPETEILQVSATDRDEKNKLIYTMQGSTDPISLKKFRLDPGTGSLYTSEKLDHETMNQHILTVMVNKPQNVFCRQ